MWKLLSSLSSRRTPKGEGEGEGDYITFPPRVNPFLNFFFIFFHPPSELVGLSRPVPVGLVPVGGCTPDRNDPPPRGQGNRVQKTEIN